MKDMTCDICGAEVERHWDLNTLVGHYQTKEIKEVCGACLSESETLLAEMRELTLKYTRKTMRRYLRTQRRTKRRGDKQ